MTDRHYPQDALAKLVASGQQVPDLDDGRGEYQLNLDDEISQADEDDEASGACEECVYSKIGG